MSIRTPTGIIVLAILATISGCSEDESPNPAGSEATVETYQGSLYDAYLDSLMASAPSMNYDSSRFAYKISSDGTYEELFSIVLQFGYMAVETGTWSESGDVYTFTPLSDSMWNSSTMSMVAATTKSPYTGALSGDVLTIENYLHIDDQRDLGTLTLTKQ